MFERSSALMSSCSDEVNLFIVDSSSVKKPLFYTDGPSPFVFVEKKQKEKIF